MNIRHAALVALLIFHSPATGQVPLRIPNKEDTIAVVYEFELSADGKAHEIKVSLMLHQKDGSNASGALTDEETKRGASLIAEHPYHPQPDQVGTKRYDFVLFDTKSREFSWGAGH